MRAMFIVLVAASGVASADPAHVVVMTDDDPAPLRATMAGRGAELAITTPPQGSLRLERAADAQRAAQANQADASVWIDRDDNGSEVCVVSADGGFFRHAPLAGDASPRAFAAIATSLLDELLAPPEIKVDVHVDVTPPPTEAPPAPRAEISLQPTPAVVTPPTSVVHATAPASADPLWGDRKVFEFGMEVGLASGGIGAELVFPLRPLLRVGLLGSAQHFIDTVGDMPEGTTLFFGAIETRILGHNHPLGRAQAHLEVGTIFGVGKAGETSQGMVYGGRISLALQRDTWGTAISFVAVVLAGFSEEHYFVPTYLLASTWQLPL